MLRRNALASQAGKRALKSRSGDVMSSPEGALTALLIACWGWRSWALLYSSYSVADAVTPRRGGGATCAVAGALVLASVLVRMTPAADLPALSLANRLLGVPSEVYTLYFAHKYVAPALGSRRFAVLLYALTLFSVVENLYSIYSDLERLQ
ncbi:unnamed protein product, partial [Iphiclides podalirius]